MIGRIGFVSNSSASSFLIWAKKYSSNVDKMENLLDSEQVAILENAGFKKTRCMFASDIDKNLNVVDFMVDKEDVQYSYFLWVSCNQVDIADFLVDNHIPFDASCHYGHYHLFYDGNEDGEVLKLLNMGNEYETYRKAHFTTDRWKDMRRSFIMEATTRMTILC